METRLRIHGEHGGHGGDQTEARSHAPIGVRPVPCVLAGDPVGGDRLTIGSLAAETAMHLMIRPVTSDDIPAILAIYAQQVLHGTASWELEPPDEPEMHRRMAAITGAGYPYLAAELDGALAGYSYAGPYRPRAGYRYVVEDSIYVAPHLQGRGIARALLAALIAECERRAFRQMVAVIGDSANIASIALHRSLGFAHVGTLTAIGYKHGRWLDSVLMQRALGPGASAPPSPGS